MVKVITHEDCQFITGRITPEDIVIADPEVLTLEKRCNDHPIIGGIVWPHLGQVRTKVILSPAALEELNKIPAFVEETTRRRRNRYDFIIDGRTAKADFDVSYRGLRTDKSKQEKLDACNADMLAYAASEECKEDAKRAAAELADVVNRWIDEYNKKATDALYNSYAYGDYNDLAIVELGREICEMQDRLDSFRTRINMLKLADLRKTFGTEEFHPELRERLLAKVETTGIPSRNPFGR